MDGKILALTHDKSVETQRADQNAELWTSSKSAYNRLKKDHDRWQRTHNDSLAAWLLKEQELISNLTTLEQREIQLGADNLRLAQQAETAEGYLQTVQNELALCDDAVASTLQDVQQIRNLTDTLSEVQHLYDTLANTHNTLNDTHYRLLSTKQQLEESLNAEKAIITDLRTQLADAQADTSNLTSLYIDLTRLLEIQNATIKSVNSNFTTFVTNLRNTLSEQSDSITSLEANLTTTIQSLNDTREMHLEAEDDYFNLRQDHTVLQDQLDQAKDDIATMEKKYDSRIQELTRVKNNLTETLSLLEEHRTAIEALNTSSVSMEKTIDNKDLEYALLHSNCSRLNIDNALLRMDLSRAQTDALNTEKRLSNHSNRLSQLQSEKSNLVSSMTTLNESLVSTANNLELSKQQYSKCLTLLSDVNQTLEVERIAQVDSYNMYQLELSRSNNLSDQLSQERLLKDALALNLTSHIEALQNLTSNDEQSREVESLTAKLNIANADLQKERRFNHKLLTELHRLQQDQTTTKSTTSTTTATSTAPPKLTDPSPPTGKHGVPTMQPRRSHHKLQHVHPSALNHRTNGWFTPLSGPPQVFLEIGKTMGSLELAHVKIPIHVKGLMHHAQYVCATMTKGYAMIKDTSANRDFYKSLILAMGQFCNSKTYELEEFYSTMTSKGIREDTLKSLKSEVHHREKRQGEFLIGLAIGAIISLVSSEVLSHGQLLDVAGGKGTTPLAIRTLQDHETRLSVSEHALQVVQNLTEEMIEDINDTRDDIQTINFSLKLRVALDDVLFEIDRLILGLQELQHHRLSPFLVDSSVLTDVLKELQFKLDRGLTLGIDHVDDLYRLPTSHIGFTNGTVLLILHIPCYRPDSVLTMYKYLRTPLPLQKYNKLLVPEVEHDYIVIDDTNSLVRTFSQDVFSSCLKLNKKFYCKDLNYYYSSHSKDCLPSLFRQDNEAALASCKFSITDSKQELFQISPNKFYLPGINSTTLTKRCPFSNPVEETQIFNSYTEISVPAGCRVTGKDYTIDGTRDIYFEPRVVHYKYLELANAWVEKQIPHFIHHVHRKMIHDIGSSKGVHIKDIASQLEHENLEYQVKLYGGIITLILVVITILSLCYCFCRGCPDICLPPRYKNIPNDEVELREIPKTQNRPKASQQVQLRGLARQYRT